MLKTQGIQGIEVRVVPKPEGSLASRILVKAENAAQGNAEPWNIFNDHALVGIKFDGLNLLYDPSYGGGPYNGSNLKAWENASLDSALYFKTTGNPPIPSGTPVKVVPNTLDEEETMIEAVPVPTP